MNAKSLQVIFSFFCWCHRGLWLAARRTRPFRLFSASFVGATLLTLVAACGGGGGSGGSGNPLPPSSTPTPPPIQQSLSCAGKSAPTGAVQGALYGCVRTLGGPNANETPPVGISVPAGWADAAVATQDQGPVTQSMYVYAGGVYHDPLRAPTGSVSTTTNAADGSFSLPLNATLTAALAQSATYYGYPGYALIEVSPVALASPCAAVPDAVANPAKPNDYPTVACGGTQPTPMPSPVANQYATYTNLFPYTAGAASQQVEGFSVSQTTGTGWLADMPIYLTQLSPDEAIMFDGAQGIRNANECMWDPVAVTCGAAIAWDGTPLISDELTEEFARYEDMLWQAYGQGNSLTAYNVNTSPHLYGHGNGVGPAPSGGSQTDFYPITYVPTPTAASFALYTLQESPCQQNVPTGERCAIEANVGFLSGFAVGYNGAHAPAEPGTTPYDWFQFYGWSPR